MRVQFRSETVKDIVVGVYVLEFMYPCGLQGALGVMIVPGILLLILGFTINEPRLPRHLWRSGQVFFVPS